MSKSIRPLLLALFAVGALLALGAMTAAGASAQEPEFKATAGHTFPESFHGLSGLAKLVTANHEIHCTEVHTTGSILANPSSTSSMLGDALFDFLHCTTKDPITGNNDPCQSAGGGTELIMTPEYEWHVGLLKLAGGVNHIVIIVLVTKTTFTCSLSVGTATVNVTGNLVGSLGEAGTHKSFSAGFAQTGAGVQEFTEAEVFLPTETKTKLELTSELTAPIIGTETEKASEVATGAIESTNEVELLA